MGVEVDGMFCIIDNLVVMFNLGFIDVEYSKVIYDLNGDGVVDQDDEELDIFCVLEIMYSFGLIYDMEVSDWGLLISWVNYFYCDKMYYIDNNLGYIDDQKILNVGIDF